MTKVDFAMKTKYPFQVGVVLTTLTVLSSITLAEKDSKLTDRKPVQSPPSNSSPLLSCVIKSDKSTYKAHELPFIDISLKNLTKSDIYIVRPTDGSSSKRRYPWCSFEIVGPKNPPPPEAFCGNLNPLVKEDFVRVRAGGEVRLSEKPEAGSASNSGPRLAPGTYRVRFVYSTSEPDIRNWLGDLRWNWDKGKKDQTLIDLFSQVPKTIVKSNEIVFKVQAPSLSYNPQTSNSLPGESGSR